MGNHNQKDGRTMATQDNDKTYAVHISREQCWKCGTFLYRLVPPMNGWPYYCEECVHLTDTREALLKKLEGITGSEAIGIVSAAPLKNPLQWVEYGYSTDAWPHHAGEF